MKTPTTSLNPDDFVPIEVIQGKIFVPLVVNEKTYRFVVDTGARVHIISPKLGIPRDLSLQATGKVGIAGAHRVRQEVYKYTLPALKIGSQSIKPFKFVEAELPIDFWEGIIGMPILRQYDFYLDLVDLKMALLTDASSIFLKHQTPFKLHKEKDILVDVSINGRSFDNFIVDTGGCCCCTYAVKDQCQLKENIDDNIPLEDGLKQVEMAFRIVADSFRFGVLERKNFPFMPARFHELVTEYQRNGMLGLDFMMGHRWMFDFHNCILHYE